MSERLATTGVCALPENRSNEQYFFTRGTINALAELCAGRTACLFTPSVGECLVATGKSDVTIFDLDHRLQGANHEYFDANRTLFDNKKLKSGPHAYQHGFQTVVADPPYSLVSPQTVAARVNELLEWDLQGDTYAYVAYLNSGIVAYERAFNAYGMVGQTVPEFEICYEHPPRRLMEKGVSLMQFRRV